MFRETSSEWSELKPDTTDSDVPSDMPLGIMAGVRYRQLQTRLNPGDAVLSYSDAIPESKDGEGRLLGQAGALRLVRDLSVNDAAEVIPSLLERIGGLAEGNLDQDDLTLLLAQATGSGPSLKDNLLAPFRYFGSVTDRTELG